MIYRITVVPKGIINFETINWKASSIHSEWFDFFLVLIATLLLPASFWYFVRFLVIIFVLYWQITIWICIYMQCTLSTIIYGPVLWYSHGSVLGISQKSLIFSCKILLNSIESHDLQRISHTLINQSNWTHLNVGKILQSSTD